MKPFTYYALEAPKECKTVKIIGSGQPHNAYNRFECTCDHVHKFPHHVYLQNFKQFGNYASNKSFRNIEIVKHKYCEKCSNCEYCPRYEYCDCSKCKGSMLVNSDRYEKVTLKNPTQLFLIFNNDDQSCARYHVIVIDNNKSPTCIQSSIQDALHRSFAYRHTSSTIYHPSFVNKFKLHEGTTFVNFLELCRFVHACYFDYDKFLIFRMIPHEVLFNDLVNYIFMMLYGSRNEEYFFRYNISIQKGVPWS